MSIISCSPWFTKSIIMSSANGTMTASVSTIYMAVTFIADSMPSFILSTFCAPMFCPQYVAMATPMFSKTHVNKYFTRIDAVNDATYIVPSALFALCSMITPMAVIENCSPIGTPFISNRPTFLSSYARSLPVGMSSVIRFLMYSQHSAEANACDSIVATPAPSTPMPRPIMRMKSSAMFSSEAAMRK